jgi:hypothetical protein
MTDPGTVKPPRFKVGDKVKVVGPVVDSNRGMQGIVAELLPVDVVYRYRVRFSDGATRIYFGFELDHVSAESAPQAF